MNNPLDLSGQVFLVTGASSEIGSQTCRLLSKLGASILLTSRNESNLKAVKEELGEGNHYCAPFDLERAEDIPLWMESLVQKYGPLNGLVQIAGFQSLNPLRHTPLEEIESMTRVNLTSSIILFKAFAGRGSHVRNSSVVFVSSVAGLIGESGMAIYSATKGALNSMVRSLAVEFSSSQIRVNAIAPGFISTEKANSVRKVLTSVQLEKLESKHLLGFGTPEDVANAVAFLLADTGRWITGTTLVVDGGYSSH